MDLQIAFKMEIHETLIWTHGILGQKIYYTPCLTLFFSDQIN